MKEELLKTGIEGLDEIIKGGLIPERFYSRLFFIFQKL